MGILATLVTVNYAEQRKAARDANRRKSLAAFQAGIEQYYSAKKTYLVFKGAVGTCRFDLLSVNEEDRNKDAFIESQAVTGTGCAGLQGQGWGRITSHNESENGIQYKYSIAKVLFEEGFMQTVRTDPRATQTQASVTPGTYDDFVLTVCTAKGDKAWFPAEAKEYALYASLEKPKTAPVQEEDAARRLCGGDMAGHGGWNTIPDAQ